MSVTSILNKLNDLEIEIMKELSKHDTDEASSLITEKLASMAATAAAIEKGEFEYCSKCKDWYNIKSFYTETKTKVERVCTYSDPINSGGNEYADKSVTYTYRMCPKNHKVSEDRRIND